MLTTAIVLETRKGNFGLALALGGVLLTLALVAEFAAAAAGRAPSVKRSMQLRDVAQALRPGSLRPRTVLDIAALEMRPGEILADCGAERRGQVARCCGC